MVKNNKSRLLLLPSLFICLISFYAINGQAAASGNQVAYTQALSSDLRSQAIGKSEIIQKLPLNTRVYILERGLALVSVQLADNPSVQGWLHQKQLDKRPVTLDKVLRQFQALEQSRIVPDAHPEKLEWIEKAAVLAPDNIAISKKLVETLRNLKQFDRADQVAKRTFGLKADRIAYTLASSSNLRSHSLADAEIVEKLPINTQIKILRKKGEWASVQVVDNASVEGWLHRSLFAWQPLSLDESLRRYNNSPKYSPRRLKWIERAAALAPRDTAVLDEFIETLRDQKLNERADMLWVNVAQLKAERFVDALKQNPQTASVDNGTRLFLYLKQLSPGNSIRGNFELASLEHLLDMPIFLSGPHQNGRFDFNATRDFGRYNPEFIRFVTDELLSDSLQDSIYADMAKTLFGFTAYPDVMVRMGHAWCSIQKQPDRYRDFKKVYQKMVESGQRFSSAHSGALGSYQDSEYKYYVSDLAFWARRDWDGSSELVKEALAKSLHWFNFVAYHQMIDCFQPPGSRDVKPVEYMDQPVYIGYQESTELMALGQLAETSSSDSKVTGGGDNRCLIWPSFSHERAERCNCNEDLKNLELSLPENLTPMTACLMDWNNGEKIELKNTKLSLDRSGDGGSYPMGSLYLEGDLQVEGEIVVDSGPAGLLWFIPNWEYKNSSSMFRHSLNDFKFLNEAVMQILFKVSPEIIDRDCMSAPATIQISGLSVLIEDTRHDGAYAVNPRVLHVGDYRPCSNQ